MKEIKITVRADENFTPAQLMKRYADQTAGVKFQRGYWGDAQLIIEGQCYSYHHWGITATEGRCCVMLFLHPVEVLH